MNSAIALPSLRPAQLSAEIANADRRSRVRPSLVACEQARPDCLTGSVSGGPFVDVGRLVRRGGPVRTRLRFAGGLGPRRVGVLLGQPVVKLADLGIFVDELSSRSRDLREVG